MHGHQSPINSRPSARAAERQAHNSQDLGVLVEIGGEIIVVYGNDQLGWSMDRGDLCFDGAKPFRYRSLEELWFALVNLSLSPEGRA